MRFSSLLPTVSPRLARGATLALVVVGTSTVAAQPSTTAELRDACQSSPGHVVVLDQATTIAAGPRAPATERVATRCTIVLGPNAKLETEGVSLTFAGPLVIDSRATTELKLTRTLLSAPTIAVQLAGTGSALEASFTNLEATAGALALTFGAEGKLNLQGHLPAMAQEALAAATTVTVRGGQKFTAQLAELRVRGERGVELAMTGAESTLSAKQAWITADAGAVAITAAATAQVELSETNLIARDLLAVRLAGAGSLLKLQQVGMAGLSETQIAPGGLLLEVGAGAAGQGQLEASGVAFYDLASIRVRASVGGQGGGLKLHKSNLRAEGEIVLETGAQGSTEVLDNDGRALTRFRVATGAGGSCTQEQNRIPAATYQLCR